jgi:hypothetical protein
MTVPAEENSGTCAIFTAFGKPYKLFEDVAASRLQSGTRPEARFATIHFRVLALKSRALCLFWFMKTLADLVIPKAYIPSLAFASFDTFSLCLLTSYDAMSLESVRGIELFWHQAMPVRLLVTSQRRTQIMARCRIPGSLDSLHRSTSALYKDAVSHGTRCRSLAARPCSR